MNPDVPTILQIIEEALYAWIGAVKGGAYPEAKDAKEAQSRRVHFSTDNDKRRNQQSFHWVCSAKALRNRGARYQTREVPGRVLQSYRRRTLAATKHRDLLQIKLLL